MTHSDKPQTPHRIVRNTKTVFVLSDQIWGWFVMQQEITKIDGFFGKLACKMRTKRLSGGRDPAERQAKVEESGKNLVHLKNCKRPVWLTCTVMGSVVQDEVEREAGARPWSLVGLRRSLGFIQTTTDATEGF